MNFKSIFFDNAIFGLLISLATFEFARYLFNKYKNPLLNPLLISGLIVIIFLSIFNVPVEQFNKGASVLDLLLGPATVALLIPLYKQLHLLKKHYIPILTGAVVGAVVAMISVYFLGKLLGINPKMIISFIPKSITTPFGIEASKMIGGIPAITVFSIVVTGIAGNVMATSVYKLVGDLHPIAKGVGIGCSSHLGGTAKALEIGEIEGAMSATSIVVSGVITIIILQIIMAIM